MNSCLNLIYVLVFVEDFSFTLRRIEKVPTSGQFDKKRYCSRCFRISRKEMLQLIVCSNIEFHSSFRIFLNSESSTSEILEIH